MRKTDKDCLINFLLGQAKLAIWITRRNQIQDRQVTDPLLVFRGMVLEFIRIECVF